MSETSKNIYGTEAFEQYNATHKRLARERAIQLQNARIDRGTKEDEQKAIQEAIDNPKWWTFKDVAAAPFKGVYNAGLSTYNLGAATVGKGHTAFSQDDFAESDTIIGGAVSGISQWATGLAGGLGLGPVAKKLGKKKLKKDIAQGKKGSVPFTSKAGSAGTSARVFFQGAMQGAASGAFADFVALDPAQGDPAQFLLEKGKVENWDADTMQFLKDWIAIDVEEFSRNERTLMNEYTARFKNTGQGILLGGALGSVMQMFKHFKHSKKVNLFRADLEAIEKNMLDLQAVHTDFAARGQNPKALNENPDWIALNKELLAAQTNFKNAVETAQKNFVNVEQDLDIIKNIITDFDSGFGEIDPSILTKTDVKTINKGNAKVPFTSIDLSKYKNPQSRTHLYRVNKNTGEVGLDLNAIKTDFYSDESLPYLSGNKDDLVTGEKSKISLKEQNVMLQTGVDPTRIKAEIVRLYGAGEEGLEAYQNFFIQRSKLVLKYAEEAGIPKDKLFMGTKATDKIYAKATYDSLFEKGLNLDQNNIKLSYVGKLTPEGPLTDDAQIAKTILKETDLPQFLRNLQSAKAPNPSNRGMTLSQLAQKGDMFTAETFTTSQKTRQTMAAVLATNERYFKQTFASYDDLAFASGWKGVNDSISDPRSYVIDDIRSFLKELKTDDDGLDFVQKLEQDLLEADGIFEGGGVSSLSSKSLDDLPPKELSATAGRVFALRSRINARARHIDERSVEWQRLSEEGQLSEEDMAEFVLAQYGLLRDLTEIRLSARNAGKTLAAHRQYDKLLAQLQDARATNNKAEIARLEKSLIEGVGGERKLKALIALQTEQAKNQKFAAVTNYKDLETIKAVNRLEKAAGRDLGEAFNDLMINAMLSAPGTHTVNLSSNVVKAVYNLASEFAGGFFAPTNVKYMFGFGKKDFEQKWKVLGKEVDNQTAKEFARNVAYDQFVYSIQTSYDVLRLFFKNADDDGLIHGSPDELGRLKTAGKMVDHAFTTDTNLGQNLGSKTDYGYGPSTGAATSERIGNSLKSMAYNATVIGGPAAKNAVEAIGNTKVVQGFAKLWDGFYQSVWRQPTRKMNLADQLMKRIHFDAKTRAVVLNHGLLIDNISKDQLPQYVEDRVRGLILDNGTLFTEQGLKEQIYKQLKAEVDPITKEPRWSGKALTTKAGELFKRQSVVRDPDTGEVIMTLEQRVDLARLATDWADEATFTSDLDKYAELKYQNEKAFQKNRNTALNLTEDNVTKKHVYSKSASDAARNHPVARFFLPFVQTPVNIWREALTSFPLLGMAHHKHVAEMGHHDPSVRAKAMGRQMIGAALWGSAAAFAVGNRITGGLSKDSRQRAAQRGAGYSEYAMRMSNGYQIQFGRLEPLAIPFKMAADYNELYRYVRAGDEDLSFEEYASIAVTGLASTATSSTWARGASEMAIVLADVAAQPDADASDLVWKAAQTRLQAFVPSFVKDVGPKQLDELERQTRGLQQKMIDRIWPYGIPPKRDPIFGYVTEKNEVWGNKAIQVLNPLRVILPQKNSLVYNEIVSLFGGAKPPAFNFGGNPNINMTKYHAYYGREKSKARKTAEQAAKYFVAKGGKRCPIAEGQDFYDFYQQYIATRRVKYDLSHLSYMKERIDTDYPNLSLEEKDQVKAIYDGFEKYVDGKKPMSLEEVLIGFISSKQYQDVPANPAMKDHKSFRLELLQKVISNWREDAMDELLGKDEDDPTGLIQLGVTPDKMVPIVTYKGIISEYWPDLTRDILAQRKKNSVRTNRPLVEETEAQTKSLEQLELPVPNPIDQ